MPTDRPHQFKIMLSDDEKSWLEKVAVHRGLSAADVLRLMVRDAHEALVASFSPMQRAILAILAPASAGKGIREVAEGLLDIGFGHGRQVPGMGEAMEGLHRGGYLERDRATHAHVITAKGRAAVQ